MTPVISSVSCSAPKSTFLAGADRRRRARTVTADHRSVPRRWRRAVAGPAPPCADRRRSASAPGQAGRRAGRGTSTAPRARSAWRVSARRRVPRRGRRPRRCRAGASLRELIPASVNRAPDPRACRPPSSPRRARRAARRRRPGPRSAWRRSPRRSSRGLAPPSRRPSGTARASSSRVSPTPIPKPTAVICHQGASRSLTNAVKPESSNSEMPQTRWWMWTSPACTLPGHHGTRGLRRAAPRPDQRTRRGTPAGSGRPTPVLARALR